MDFRFGSRAEWGHILLSHFRIFRLIYYFQDVKECSQSTHGCSDECVEMEGSYECRCPDGFRLEDDLKTCVDIDECEQDGHGCQFCRNLQGSYECYCPDGYELRRFVYGLFNPIKIRFELLNSLLFLN